VWARGWGYAGRVPPRIGRRDAGVLARFIAGIAPKRCQIDTTFPIGARSFTNSTSWNVHPGLRCLTRWCVLATFEISRPGNAPTAAQAAILLGEFNHYLLVRMPSAARHSEVPCRYCVLRY
jgi:hypothetical protein